MPGGPEGEAPPLAGAEPTTARRFARFVRVRGRARGPVEEAGEHVRRSLRQWASILGAIGTAVGVITGAVTWYNGVVDAEVRGLEARADALDAYVAKVRPDVLEQAAAGTDTRLALQRLDEATDQVTRARFALFEGHRPEARQRLDAAQAAALSVSGTAFQHVGRADDAVRRADAKVEQDRRAGVATPLDERLVAQAKANLTAARQALAVLAVKDADKHAALAERDALRVLHGTLAGLDPVVLVVAEPAPAPGLSLGLVALAASVGVAAVALSAAGVWLYDRRSQAR